jgi:AcrR family transcriptional regulator
MNRDRASAQPAAPLDGRQEILETALRAFSAKGYASVSLQEITDELGITKAAIYYHFSKRQILGESLDRAGMALMAQLRAVVEKDLPPAEALRQVHAEHVSHVLAHRTLYSVYFSDLSELDAAGAGALLQNERLYAATVSQLVSRAISASAFREVEARTTTLSILGMCHSTVRWFQPSRHVGANELAAEVADLVLDGLRARATQPRASQTRAHRPQRSGGPRLDSTPPFPPISHKRAS